VLVLPSGLPGVPLVVPSPHAHTRDATVKQPRSKRVCIDAPSAFLTIFVEWAGPAITMPAITAVSSPPYGGS
jgi:hypothetical protein